ncbi:hypothetical protein H8D36_02275 [archaeon]|nr:hypothetical protein [archaeon]MBL7057267.1 hypothetical protein [Candidatus Woesearchaeota archaeon]
MDKINTFISEFTNFKIEGIVKKGRRYYCANEEQIKLSEKIDRDLFSIGMFFGEQKKKFEPTPALIEIIAKHSDKKAFVNKKAEWLFLCGRDILGESIIKTNVTEGLILVQNEKDENIGYGLIKKRKGIYEIKNLLDRGNYLRREH